MPVVSTLEELLVHLGGAISSPDPLAALKEQGVTLAPSLEQQLNEATTAKKLTAEERKRLATEAAKLGTVRFNVRPLQPLAKGLPKNEFDFIVSLRLDIVNETLTALFADIEWPKEIKDADGLLTLQRLRRLSEDVPTSDNIRVGTLHLTGPAEIAPLDGTSHALIRLPFSLDIVSTVPISLPPSLGGLNRKLTSLDGVFRFGVALEPQVDGDELRLLVGAQIGTATDEEMLHIEVDPDSPMQPRSREVQATVEQEIDLLFRGSVAAALDTAAGSVCPVVKLPLGEGASLRVVGIQVRTVANESGGVVRVGVLVDERPDLFPSDRLLVTDPFTTDTANVHVRAHEELIRKVTRVALDSGALEAAARKKDDDLRIDDASVDLKPNELRLILDGRVVDACGVFGHFIDVNFRATVTFRLSIFGGKAFVTQETDINLSNADVAVCVLTAALELAIASGVGNVIGLLGDLLFQFHHFTTVPPDTGEQKDPFQVVTAVFDPLVSVPGTEVLPKIEALQALVDDQVIQSFGVLTLRPDDINTYIHVAFRRRVGQLGETIPIADVPVEVVDQDRPIPTGDDAPIPEPTNEVVTHNDKVHVTVSTFFRPPRGNQLLAKPKNTNSRGEVRFVLTPQQLQTSAGAIVTLKETKSLQTGESTLKTTETSVVERRPDVFFRVRTPDGVIDTRKLASLLLNLRSRRIGSPDAPLTFVTGSGGVLV